jgi:hypothetical protein
MLIFLVYLLEEKPSKFSLTTRQVSYFSLDFIHMWNVYKLSSQLWGTSNFVLNTTHL